MVRSIFLGEPKRMEFFNSYITGITTMSKQPKTYRIATNGLKFKIQYLKHYYFLWWRWDCWKNFKTYPCGYSCVSLADSIEQIKQELKEIQQKEKATLTGWHPWKEGG